MPSATAGLPPLDGAPRHDRPARSGWRRWLADLVHLGWLHAALLALALSPSSWTPSARRALGRQLVADTLPILAGFSLLAALLTLVITRIVVVTASSYGLSQYALEMVIRVLVLELLPLTACLFVALRTTIASGAALGRLRRLAEEAAARQGQPAARRDGLPQSRSVMEEALARTVAGLFACVTLAALSCVVATVLAYLAVYGLTGAGLESFTRVFGRIFDGTVTLVLLLKTACFALAVSVTPMASALPGESAGGVTGRSSGTRESLALRGLVRIFAVLVLLEVLSLAGNYL